MNIAKFEKLSAKLVFTVAAIGLTLFAGAKHGSPTNTPPLLGLALGPRSTEESSLLSTPTPTTYTYLTNWHARGAWIDWTRISFPAGFTFQTSTKQLTEVTLMSYGEIRSSLRGQTLANFSQLPTASYQLPTLLALKPGVSSVGYGLTPSNSLVFVWQDCYANREPTNCVSAEIELFANGETAVRYRGIETRTPAPEVIGDGQDEDWIRATFPDVATNILATGYASWLDDWVGVDEQNGRFQAAVTIPSLPADDSPCHLVCGSYKVNVTSPGTYRFPLEVFDTCEVRTYPTAVPFSIDFDDGYTGDGTSYEIVEVPDTPPLLMMAAPQNQNDNSALHLTTTPTLLTFSRFYMRPIVLVTPDMIPLSTANGTRVAFWCNMVYTGLRYAAEDLYLTFFGSEAEIHDSYVAQTVDVVLIGGGYECGGEFTIYEDDDDPADDPDEPEEPEREDATVFFGETPHYEVTNDCTSTCLTAVTTSGSTAENDEMITVLFADSPSADVYVYMATTESGTDEYDDAFGWTVTVNGAVALQGQASVSDYFGDTGGSAYGISSGAVLLASGHYTKPSDDILRIRLQCSAQNVGDGLKETCVQILVVPTE